MNELALFAGAGGGILGGHLLGWRTVAAVEIEDYPRRVLLQRQADGILPRFPIWDDVQTFDGKPWRGKVDVISGGFPCQDISAAGKGAGIEGKRSGLWGEMARIVGEVRPSFVFVENSPLLVGRGLAVVLGDLAEMGYDAKWGIVGAHHVAAPHKRDRIWIVAHSRQQGLQGSVRPREANSGGTSSRIKRPGEICEMQQHVADTGLPKSSRRKKQEDTCSRKEGRHSARHEPSSCDRKPSPEQWWITEPELGRVAHGVANRVDRLKALGNGQVPAVVRLAWEILTEGNCKPDCQRPRKKIRRTD